MLAAEQHLCLRMPETLGVIAERRVQGEGPAAMAEMKESDFEGEDDEEIPSDDEQSFLPSEQ